jgi:hypothetical protein
LVGELEFLLYTVKKAPGCRSNALLPLRPLNAGNTQTSAGIEWSLGAVIATAFSITAAIYGCLTVCHHSAVKRAKMKKEFQVQLSADLVTINNFSETVRTSLTQNYFPAKTASWSSQLLIPSVASSFLVPCHPALLLSFNPPNFHPVSSIGTFESSKHVASLDQESTCPLLPWCRPGRSDASNHTESRRRGSWAISELQRSGIGAQAGYDRSSLHHFTESYPEPGIPPASASGNVLCTRLNLMDTSALRKVSQFLRYYIPQMI